jgi:hypothetical protein
LQRDGCFERVRLDQFGQPFPERPIAHLIVVLQKKHETLGRQIAARRASRSAAAIDRRVPLENKSL